MKFIFQVYWGNPQAFPLGVNLLKKTCCKCLQILSNLITLDLNRFLLLGKGWSEPAATNAPVEDELVQPVLRMNILQARRGFFFHLLFASKFSTSPLLPTPSYLPPTKPTPPPTSTLLPTTYQPHTPSLHRQSSRDLERLWSESWELWLWSGSWSGWSWSGWSWSGTHTPMKR